MILQCTLNKYGFRVYSFGSRRCSLVGYFEHSNENSVSMTGRT
jgi:hypothetical protein